MYLRKYGKLWKVLEIIILFLSPLEVPGPQFETPFIMNISTYTLKMEKEKICFVEYTFSPWKTVQHCKLAVDMQ